MPSPSRLPRPLGRDRAPLRLVPSGRGFLSLPGDAGPLDASWLESVLRDLTRRHERVLVLLDAELGSYDRPSARGSAGAFRLDPAEVDDEISALAMRRWRELDLMRRRMPQTVSTRVHLATWSHFIDPSFAAIWRHLLSAFAQDSAFRDDVLRLAHDRLRRGRHAAAARMATLRAIESLAMRVRVGEMAGYHSEYGSGRDAPLATALFRGAYAAEGLTVEALVGVPSRRVYRQIGQE